MDMRKAVICVALFLLMQITISFAVAGNTRNVLYYPGDYEGNTLVFEKAKIGGAIMKNSHTGFYCLCVEIDGEFTPGILYKSQLNFVVASPELADKLATQLSQNSKYHKATHEINLMNHLNRGGACPVRLTAKIQKLFGYWIAVVSKIEFYGNESTIINTVN